MSPQQELDLFYAFDGQPVHCFLHEGQPAWMASQVGSALKLGDPNQSLRKSKLVEEGVDYAVIHPNSLKGPVRHTVPLQTKSVTILYESGLYALVLRSEKPTAMRFTRWVIREVLPELRRGGGYALLPKQLQPEELSQAQVLKLVDLAGRKNAWAVGILRQLGLSPAPEEPEEGGHAEA